MHCGECDACIIVMDHHCPFVSNCIGGRNYGLFFKFVTFLILNGIMVLVDCALELAKRSRQPQSNLKNAIKRYPVLLLLCIFVGIASFMLFSLWGYHLRLALSNETTNEVIKKINSRFRQSPNDTGSKINNLRARFIDLSESAP